MTSTELVSMTRDEVVAYLRGDDIAGDTDTTESDYELALKVLGAETLEKALEPEDVRKSETLVGSTFAILGVSWRRSVKHKKEGERYAFITCADAAGTKFYTSCGATQVVLILTRLIRDGSLPAVMTLTATETDGGNTLLRLEIPEADAESF